MSEEHIVEAEFEEVKEEETETPETDKKTIERGIVIFHDQDGSLSFNILGQLTLQDISYYKRYLDKIEQEQWDSQKSTIGDADA